MFESKTSVAEINGCEDPTANIIRKYVSAEQLGNRRSQEVQAGLRRLSRFERSGLGVRMRVRSWPPSGVRRTSGHGGISRECSSESWNRIRKTDGRSKAVGPVPCVVCPTHKRPAVPEAVRHSPPSGRPFYGNPAERKAFSGVFSAIKNAKCKM